MKLRIIAVLAAVLFAAAFLIFAPESKALSRSTVSDCGEIDAVYYDENGSFYILGKINNRYIVTEIDENCSVSHSEVEIDAENSPYAYFDGVFYFFTNGADVSNGSPLPFVTVTSFECDSGTILKRTINNAEPVQRGTYAFDGRCFYLPEPAFVNIYNSKYRFEERISLDDWCKCIESAHGGSAVYCVCSNSVVMITDRYVERINIAAERIYPFGDKFSDDNSIVYTMNGETILYDGFDPSHGVGEIGGWLIGVKNGSIAAVNGDRELLLSDVSQDVFISGSGRCICVSQNGNDAELAVITQADIIAALSAKTSDPSDDGNARENYSDAYSINTSDHTVRGIEPGTTVVSIKNNTGGTVIDMSGSAAKGIASTGMRLALNNDYYNIIIDGDVNGTGTVNSADLDRICDHICGEKMLDGVYLQAADVNDDGIVDLKDADTIKLMVN